MVPKAYFKHRVRRLWYKLEDQERDHDAMVQEYDKRLKWADFKLEEERKHSHWVEKCRDREYEEHAEYQEERQLLYREIRELDKDRYRLLQRVAELEQQREDDTFQQAEEATYYDDLWIPWRTH